MSIQSNPYVAGHPVQESLRFFGRRDTLARILNNLGNNRSLAIFGQRRIGKTSLLLRLQKDIEQRSNNIYLPVYYNVQSVSDLSLGSVLADLADEISLAIERVFNLRFGHFDHESFDNEGRYFRRRFLPEIYRCIKNIRIVFLVDEFDSLNHSVTSDLSANIAGRALGAFISRLMDTDDRLHFIFAVGLRADELTQEVKRILESSLKESVWILDEDGARDLILQAHKNGTLRFSAESVARIMEITNRHPYLTQLLCQVIWDRAYSNEHMSKHIGPSDVDSAINVALDRGDYALSSIWDGMEPIEKIFSAALCHSKGDTVGSSVRYNLDEAHAILVDVDIPIDMISEIKQAPSNLIHKRFLRSTDFHNFEFEYDIFRRWIRKQKPIADVIVEVSSYDPEVEKKMKEGKRFLDQKRWREANQKFSDVLATRPRNYEAYIFRAETYKSNSNFPKAVRDLRQAYRFNSWVAEKPLAQTLAQYAQILELADPENALKLVDEALKFFPNEKLAKEIRSKIWIKRGNQDRDAGDLMSALQSYESSGDGQRITAIKAQIEERCSKLSFELDKRLEDIINRTVKLRQMVDSAISICKTTAENSYRHQTSVIWWAIIQILHQEVYIVHTLLEGIHAISEGRHAFALFKFSKESIVVRIDGEHSRTEHQRKRGDGEKYYQKHVDKSIGCIWDIMKCARTVRIKISESRALVQDIEKFDEVKTREGRRREMRSADVQETWEAAESRLSEREKDFHKYWEAMRDIRENNIDDAQRVLGWNPNASSYEINRSRGSSRPS